MAGAILHAMQRFCQAKPWAFSVKRHIASPATVGRLEQYAQWAATHADSRDAFAIGWQAPCQGTPAQASQGCNEIVTAWIETWEGRKGAKPPAETTDAEMQLHLLGSWPTLTGVRDHQATIHWSPSIQRTLHGPQIGWLSAASNMMSRAFCTSTSSQGPTPTAHHTLRALHHCVTKNMTTPATNTNVCAWVDKAHTRRFVRATLDADHLLL